MRKWILLFLCVVFLGAFAPKAKAGVNVNINVNLFPQYDGFVSGYYGIPEPEVVYYQDRLHSWQDAATLFFACLIGGERWLFAKRQPYNEGAHEIEQEQEQTPAPLV